MRRLARRSLRTLTQGVWGIGIEVVVLGILFTFAALSALVLIRVF